MVGKKKAVEIAPGKTHDVKVTFEQPPGEASYGIFHCPIAFTFLGSDKKQVLMMHEVVITVAEADGVLLLSTVFSW